MKIIYADGIHEINKPTTDKDARRLAIKLTDEFLIEHENMRENDLLNISYWYEQMIYQSAKKLKLSVETIAEEIRINDLNKKFKGTKMLSGERYKEINPLRLVSEHELQNKYKGKFVIIKLLEEKNGEEIRTVLNRKGVDRFSRS